MTPLIRVKDLSVRYGRSTAVSGISFDVAPGEALGLLGANGAGKSSTVKAILGMLKPSTGEVRVFDSVPGSLSVLERTGFAPEEALPPEKVTGQEYLMFLARLRIADASSRETEVRLLLEQFDLTPNKRVSAYSKGMRRRLVLAQAFIGTPELLILDEPLNGLDPLIILKLRQRLEAYRQAGGTLIYSSHILAEVEKSCSRILILKNGHIVLDSSTSEAVGKYGSVEAAFEATAGGAA